MVFFSNKQAQANVLPLTKAALQQHILRSHFQLAFSIKAFPEIGTPVYSRLVGKKTKETS
jgi:hypothetical protein